MKKIGQQIKRLFLLYTLLLLCIFAGFTQLHGYLIEDNVINQQIRTEAHYLEQQYQATAALPLPRYPWMKIVNSWQQLPPSVQKLHDKEPERIEFITEAGNIHIVPLQLNGQEALLYAEVDAFTVTNKVWPLNIAGVAFLGTLIFALCSWFLMNRVETIVAPLNRLSQRVQSDTPQLLFPAGFTASLPDNEVGFLARSIEKQWHNLTHLLERETQFTRDISHELRTPISILQNTLYQSGPLSQDDEIQARNQLNKLTQTLDVLTALAREESRNRRPLNVLSVLEDVTMTSSLSGLRPDFELNIDVPDDYQVVANETLLYLLFRNLIENAHYHGSDNTLTISLQQPSLRFSNQTNHASETLSPAGPTNAAAPLGIGQGLFLARRIVEFHQGELTVSSSHRDSNNDFSVYLSLPGLASPKTQK